MDEEDDLLIATWLFAELELPGESPATDEDLLPLLDIDEIIKRINEIHRSCPSPAGGAYADSKTDAEAKRFREMGVTACKNKQYDEALTFLSQSVASAPEDSQELARAYNERAFVLFQIGDYQASVMDVNRAAEKNKSASLSRKLQDRKRRCMKEYRSANNRSIKGTVTDPEEIPDEGNTETLDWSVSTVFDPPNVLLPRTSALIELVEIKPDNDERWGSSIRATGDIKPGQLLSIEEHYVMSVDPHKRFKNCAYCLRMCDNLIPCPSCTQTMYCSRRCRDAAYDSYHRTECKMIKFYDRVEAERRDAIAMQAFLRGTKQGKELPALMKKLAPYDIFEPLEGYNFETPFNGDYLDLVGSFELIFHDDVATDVAEAIPTAVKMVLALRALSFFSKTKKKRASGRLSEMELYAVLLLVNNLVMLGRTNYEVLEKAPTDPENEDILTERMIGLCVPMLHSYLNTSCNPNTQIVIKNRHRFLFATRPIKAGEPLFYAFRHLYAIDSKENRAAIFGRRGFTCMCEACHNDWPKKPELVDLKIRYLKENGKRELLDSLRENYRSVARGRLLDMLKATEIVQFLAQHVTLVNDHLDKPSYDLLLCEEMLVRAHKTYFSEFHRNDEIGYIAFLKISLSLLVARLGNL